MKKLLLLSVSLLIAAVCFSQKIKVTVTESQIFNKFGTHDNNQVIESPDEDRGKKTIDCDYVFDLEKMTSTFYSRSAGGVGNTLPIVNVTKKGSLYIIETIDYNIDLPQLSYPTKIYVDVDAKTMLFTWHDTFFDRSFVSKCHKLTMSIDQMQ